MATPNITLAIVPFLALAMTKASPPKNAISTSLISGFVRARSSDDSSRKGKNSKNKYAVKTLRTTITAKLRRDRLKVSISLTAMDMTYT